MKAVLLSIKPKYCELIANGKKTTEVRKTRPKLEPPFRCYIYCTQGDMLSSVNGVVRRINQMSIDLTKPYAIRMLNGKVIGEFVCDKMYVVAEDLFHHLPLIFEEIGTTNRKDVQAETCLSKLDILDYLNGNPHGYGWHVSNLKIYDEPIELQAFFTKNLDEVCPALEDMFSVSVNRCGVVSYSPKPKEIEYKLKRPPQSWCYVEGVEE